MPALSRKYQFFELLPPSIKENHVSEKAITNDKFDMEVAYNKGVMSINKREMDEILV